MEVDPLSPNSEFIKREAECLSLDKVFNPNLIVKPEMGHSFFTVKGSNRLCTYILRGIWCRNHLLLESLVKILLILLSLEPSALPGKINVC